MFLKSVDYQAVTLWWDISNILVSDTEKHSRPDLFQLSVTTKYVIDTMVNCVHFMLCLSKTRTGYICRICNTHAEVALPARGNYIFKAMKLVVSKKYMNCIPECLIIRNNLITATKSLVVPHGGTSYQRYHHESIQFQHGQR